ncbi:MAG: TonB-dependent receptor plug domain-containing protein [Verrucomicrobiaceae bacterium]
MFRSILLLPLSLAAQDTLPDLVVTASRTQEERAEAPYSSEIITAGDLLNESVRTLPQAFLDTPGVLVQQTTPGHGSPYIRGFNGRQTLLLQDGIRLNNSTWRSGPVQYWNTLDSQAIDRLELIKSQGSVLYGSDAIGGTVNILSKSSGFRDENAYFSNGATSYRFDTNSRSHLGRLEQSIGVGREWGLMLGISSKNIGDIKDSALGRMTGTGYAEQSLDFKFEYALSDSQTLTLAHTYLNQDDINRWHNTTANPGWRHGNSFTTAGTDLQRTYDQERALTYLRLEDSNPAAPWLNSWQLTTSYQKSQDSEFRVRGSGQSDTKILDVDTYGLTFQAESPLGKGDLVWGADYYHDVVDSAGFRNGAIRPSNRPVADDSTYHSLGLFANFSRDLTDRFSYDAGARFSYAEADWNGYRPAGAAADQSGNASWENLSLSLRGNYQATDHWSLFGGLSQAFRAPNLDDLTGAQFALNGLTSSGSPNVDPETFLTAELGARFANDELSYGLTGYYTFIDDAITRIDDGTGGLITVNGSDGYIYGLEAEAAWNFHSDWQLAGHLAWQDGKAQQAATLGGPIVEDTIRRMHPLTASASLTWTHPSDKFWVSGRILAAAHQNNLSNQAANDTQRIPVNGTPSYLVTSLYTGMQATENVQLNLALENLTDQDYRIHGSGQNAPGLNATFGVRIEW